MKSINLFVCGFRANRPATLTAAEATEAKTAGLAVRPLERFGAELRG